MPIDPTDVDGRVPVTYPGDPACPKCKGWGAIGVSVPIDPASVPYKLSFMQATYGRQYSQDCVCKTRKLFREFATQPIFDAFLARYRGRSKESPANAHLGKCVYATGEYQADLGVALGGVFFSAQNRRTKWIKVTDSDIIQTRFNGTEVTDANGEKRTTKNTEHLLGYDLVVLELGIFSEKNAATGDKLATFVRDAIAKHRVVWVVANKPLSKGDPVWSTALQETLDSLPRIQSGQKRTASPAPSPTKRGVIRDDYVSALDFASPLDDLEIDQATL